MSKHAHKKLELTWIGKGEQIKLEPRILIEDTEYSYGDRKTDNMLIHGDNLLALKALEQDFTGKIKCIYIDPPYNTGSAFEHYDDGIEHSQWLNLLTPRLKILHNLLSDDGTIWISIDDNECHYLKVVCDEIFGRNNFFASVIWQKRTSPEARYRLGAAHDYILVFCKNIQRGKNALNQLAPSEARQKDFKNPDNDPLGPWASVDLTGMSGHATASQFYTITAPNGKTHKPPAGRCWVYSEKNLEALIERNKVWFGNDGNARPRLKRYLYEMEGQNSWTWWPNTEVGHNQEAKKEIIALFGDDRVFDTPKPERLLQRILTIATNPNDIVLDSFLGSGTTAAVAQKMGRRWIGVELGDHAKTHCFPRLKKVVNGDQGGISSTVNWKGGGGFNFYSLASSLLNQDKYGNWVISKDYNAQMLAAAMAKQEGFQYKPSESTYWKQGQSSEQDFIFTTTQFITAESIEQIYTEMKEGESLLICCKAYQQECKNKYANITIKKIPQMLLGRCEFGKDDYSLNIVNLPTDDGIEIENDISIQEILDKRNAKEIKDQQSLFD